MVNILNNLRSSRPILHDQLGIILFAVQFPDNFLNPRLSLWIKVEGNIYYFLASRMQYK